MRPLRRLTVLPTVPAALEPLRALARNLRWSWHPPTQELFAAMDAEGWEASGHNPLRMLNEADPRSEEHTSELQSRENLVCRLLLEKKKKKKKQTQYDRKKKKKKK